jgi:hypothetical protein
MAAPSVQQPLQDYITGLYFWGDSDLTFKGWG